MIACVVIPFFATALERRHDPTLSHAPLCIVRYSAKRGKVVAASAEAQRVGVQPGLSLSRARALCPQANFVTEDETHLSSGLDQLLETLWTFSNRVEVDESALPQAAVCYLDLGQVNEASALELGNGLLDAVRARLRLDCAIGIASGKFPAYVAAVTDRPLTLVARGQEATFVAPHPVALLPLEREVERKLALLAIREIGQLASLSREAFAGQFGKGGRTLWLLARGLDGRWVKPRRMPPAERGVSVFDPPLTTRDALDDNLHLLAGELADRLEGRGAALHRISLTLKVAHGETHAEELHLLQPVASASGIAEAAMRLLERMRLNPSAREDGLEMLEMCLTHLVSSAPRQLELFTHKPARQELIDLAAVLVQRYGGCFYEAVAQEQGAILPERRFRFLRVDVS